MQIHHLLLQDDLLQIVSRYLEKLVDQLLQPQCLVQGDMHIFLLLPIRHVGRFVQQA